jgi:hypothetical protein
MIGSDWQITALDKEHDSDGKIKATAVLMRRKDGKIECLSGRLDFPEGTHDSAIRQGFIELAENEDFEKWARMKRAICGLIRGRKITTRPWAF